MLADLTFETLPVEGSYVLVLSIWWLLLFLCQHPILKALEVNQTNGTLAFACDDKWVSFILLRTPADSALNLILTSSIKLKIFETLDLLSLFEFLVIKLTFTHGDLITLEIFYSEANSSKFDGVKFLNLIVVFSGFIFKRSSDQPKSVDTLFFLSCSSRGVIQVVALCVLLEEAETPSIGVLSLIDDIVWLVEVNLIVISYYLSLRLCFQAHLHDVPGFVVEETVRVSQP